MILNPASATFLRLVLVSPVHDNTTSLYGRRHDYDIRFAVSKKMAPADSLATPITSATGPSNTFHRADEFTIGNNKTRTYNITRATLSGVIGLCTHFYSLNTLNTAERSSSPSPSRLASAKISFTTGVREANPVKSFTLLIQDLDRQNFFMK